MYAYINSIIKYPRNAQRLGIEGRVWLLFDVEPSGNMKDLKVIKSISPSLDAEAIRVVKKMEKMWIPGKYRGQPSSLVSNVTLPIFFQLE